jgi:hypothetical protein
MGFRRKNVDSVALFPAKAKLRHELTIYAAQNLRLMK